MAAVPASDGAASPWTDSQIEGFYGRIAVRETRGDRLPVVLIHGESTAKEAFRLQMLDGLGARHRMIAIDLPGHGASDDAAEGEDGHAVTSLADAVVDTIERLGLERFALLGWSRGGNVALEVAASTPGVVGVMLVGTPPTGAGETMPAGMSDALDSDQHAVVSALGIPLAIVNGANDPALPSGAVPHPGSASLWENRVHTFPFAGHAPFLDMPELFNATLARFLHDLERRDDIGGPGLCLAG